MEQSTSSLPSVTITPIFKFVGVPDEELKRIKSSNVLAKVKTFKEMNMDFIAFEQQVFHFDSPGFLKISHLSSNTNEESFQILYTPDGQKGNEFKSIAEKVQSFDLPHHISKS